MTLLTCHSNWVDENIYKKTVTMIMITLFIPLCGILSNWFYFTHTDCINYDRFKEPTKTFAIGANVKSKVKTLPLQAEKGAGRRVEINVLITAFPIVGCLVMPRHDIW